MLTIRAEGQTENVSAALRYASLVWTSHILPELHIQELSDLRRQFIREKLLNWIELGGVTQSVPKYMSSISQLQSAMEDVLRSPIPTVVSLVFSPSFSH